MTIRFRQFDFHGVPIRLLREDGRPGTWTLVGDLCAATGDYYDAKLEKANTGHAVKPVLRAGGASGVVEKIDCKPSGMKQYPRYFADQEATFAILKTVGTDRAMQLAEEVARAVHRWDGEESRAIAPAVPPVSAVPAIQGPLPSATPPAEASGPIDPRPSIAADLIRRIFNFSDEDGLRTVAGPDGQEWFVALDLTHGLRIRNGPAAYRRVRKEWRADIVSSDGSQGRRITVLSLEGVFELIGDTRNLTDKPEVQWYKTKVYETLARDFRKTVAAEESRAMPVGDRPQVETLPAMMNVIVRGVMDGLALLADHGQKTYDVATRAEAGVRRLESELGAIEARRAADRLADRQEGQAYVDAKFAAVAEHIERTREEYWFLTHGLAKLGGLTRAKLVAAVRALPEPWRARLHHPEYDEMIRKLGKFLASICDDDRKACLADGRSRTFVYDKVEGPSGKVNRYNTPAVEYLAAFLLNGGPPEILPFSTGE